MAVGVFDLADAIERIEAQVGSCVRSRTDSAWRVDGHALGWSATPPAVTAASSSASSATAVGADVVLGDVLAERLAGDGGAIELAASPGRPRLTAPRIVWTPPELWTSSTWYLLLGATLQMFGVRRLSSLMRSMSYVDARLAGDGQDVQHGVRAAAHRHVEDHRVVDRVGGDDLAGQQAVAFALACRTPAPSATIRSAARRKSFLRSALVASSVPLVGRAMPRASHRQFMLLAVNMPEQEPQVGQPACSSASSSVGAELAALLGRGAR